MGNNRTPSFATRVASLLRHAAPIRRPRAAAGLLVSALLALAITSGRSDESGIVIYTTLDQGRDETAIAVPFVKAERFALVTNVTTADGKTVRVTNNQMKEIVHPPDLSRATVVDEAGIAAMRQRLAAFQALQLKFPRARVQLDPVVNELGRIIQQFERGNVLVTGSLMSRDDYERQAATRAKTVDLVVNGVSYTEARLRSVTGEKVSIMHWGGVASVAVGQLSDDQIARLNGTSSGTLIKRPVVAVATPAPLAVVATVPPTPPIPGTPSAEVIERPVVVEAPTTTAAAPAVPTTASLTAPVISEPSSGSEPVQPAPSTGGSTGPVGPSGSPESLLALLRSCRSGLVMADQGSAALNSLYNIPNARYGEMTLGEAEREADRQNSVREAAASGQEQLMQRLQTLRTELDRTPELPEELRKKIATFAMTKRIAPREGYGVVLLLRQADALIETVEGIVQSASPTLPPEADRQEKASPPPTAAIQQTSVLSPGVIAVLLLLLFTGTTFLTIHLTRRNRGGGRTSAPHSSIPARTRPRQVREPQKEAAGIPGWLWPTVGGGGSALLVGGLLVFVMRESPKGDDAEGLFQRGVAYRDGVGVEVDPAAAFRSFQLAAEQGHAEAQCELAMYYLDDGEVVSPDLKEGLVWLRKAEAQNSLKARANLGWCYANGYGVTKDPQRAEALILDAADKGDAQAMEAMGRLRSGNIEGFRKDPAEMFDWYRRSAELGDSGGQYGLGTCYVFGNGTAIDRVLGFRLIRQSAEQGFPPALAALKEIEGQELVMETQRRFEQQVEASMRQRPMGGNPFSSSSPTQNVSPRFEEARRRAYEGLRDQGYSDEVLRQRGYR